MLLNSIFLFHFLECASIARIHVADPDDVGNALLFRRRHVLELVLCHYFAASTHLQHLSCWKINICSIFRMYACSVEGVQEYIVFKGNLQWSRKLKRMKY